MPRGLARDHDAKRAALRKGAAAYFAAEGYDRASMAGAAAACGVSKALIYHYYAGKEALLFDILHEHLGALAQAVRQAGGRGQSPQTRLRALIRAILMQYEDADAEHKLQIDALSTLPDALQTPLLSLQREIVTEMAATLEAVSPGLGANRGVVTMTVFGMLNWFYMWHRPSGGIDRGDYADLVTNLVLGGIDAL